MNRSSAPFAVRMFGPLACFTRPELKAERVSYEIITPSAARGVFESILWKPAIRWIIEAIEIHSPIEFTQIKRNEVGKRAATPSAAVIAGRDTFEPYFADEDRQQRNTLALRDVDYVVHARFALTERAGPDDNVAKFVDMFRRRLEKGQYHRAPYLGCREFACAFEPAPPGRSPIRLTKPLGFVLHDIEHQPVVRPRFFAATIENGVVRVPPFENAEPAPEINA